MMGLFRSSPTEPEINNMVQSPIKPITLEDFLTQPETKPAKEYLHGQIIQKPMPQGEHSRIQNKLSTKIDAVIEEQKAGLAFTELRCTFGGVTIVPDISVFQWERIPRQENGRIANSFPLAPDWIIEILSPGQSQTQVMKTILHTLEEGTQLCWLIDPAEDTVIVYAPGNKFSLFTEENTRLPTPDFVENFQLTAPEIFTWLTP
jgi:Uma2 family endonuclease